MTWDRAVVAEDRTHHLLGGEPLYSGRFHAVQRYHEPGLAPAIDGTGAFHIDLAGRPAYAKRFRQTWGFYEGRAAAEDQDGWMHILADGSPLSSQRYAWCGNFQEGRCTVRGQEGRYTHLDRTGAPAYAERYSYAGDFREGAAVVRCPRRDLCTHIRPDGRPLHSYWFIDLDVFHKGFARAKDAAGWFHISRRGVPAYVARFAEVEPFYNGQAKVTTAAGVAVIDQTGATLVRVTARGWTAP